MSSSTLPTYNESLQCCTNTNEFVFTLGIMIWIDSNNLAFFIYVPEESFDILRKYNAFINDKLKIIYGDGFNKNRYNHPHKFGPGTASKFNLYEYLASREFIPYMPRMKGQHFVYVPNPRETDKLKIKEEFNEAILEFVKTIQRIEKQIIEDIKPNPVEYYPQLDYINIINLNVD